MTDDEYADLADEAEEFGIDRDQLDFLLKHFARKPHNHSIEQVDGLADALEDAGVDLEDVPDEDEEEVEEE